MFVRVNGHLLSTVSFGAGPSTFLALGGWVGNWEVWQQPFELMSSRFRCIGYDHRGAGESPVSVEDITPEALVDDVFGVMDALGVGRCVLAGESLGAVVALSAVLRAPDRFSGLVLVSGSPAVTDRVRPLIAGSKVNYEATLSRFVDDCIPEADSDHLRRWGRDIMRRSDGPSGARMFECYLERNEPPVPMDRVTVPTLVIHGTADAIVPLSVGELMARSIRGASLVRLEGVGHVPPITRPREVVDAILTWHDRL
jgi:pimeloyl-ACP methyl ester carboxylesterase